MVGSWLCARCRTRIRRLEEPLCRRCGVELFSARKDCACRVRLKSLTRLRSAVAYEGPIEPAVHRFKYEGWRRLAGPLRKRTRLQPAQPGGPRDAASLERKSTRLNSSHTVVSYADLCL